MRVGLHTGVLFFSFFSVMHLQLDYWSTVSVLMVRLSTAFLSLSLSLSISLSLSLSLYILYTE